MEHRITFPTMGTLGYAAWDGDIPGAEEALRTRVGQIEADLTRFDPDSQVSRLSGQWSEISPDTARVLVAGESFREATGGAFSVLVGEAVRAWENGEPDGGPEPCPPGAAVEVRKYDGRSYARLRQENQGTARGRTVDCGAIAKGYAADQLRDWLVEHGARRAVVSLGTSSIAAAGREPVPIGILSPWVGLERWGKAAPERRVSIRLRRSSYAARVRPSEEPCDRPTYGGTGFDGPVRRSRLWRGRYGL